MRKSEREGKDEERKGRKGEGGRKGKLEIKTDYFRDHNLSIVRSDFFNSIFWVHFFVLI